MAEKDPVERQREIIAEGATTEFWAEVKSILEDLKEQALENLLNAQGERVVELQQIYKVSDMLIATVEAYKEEQDEIDKGLAESLFEGEVEDDPA